MRQGLDRICYSFSSIEQILIDYHVLSTVVEASAIIKQVKSQSYLHGPYILDKQNKNNYNI